MTVDELSWAVGTQAASRLMVLKSRMADTPEERMAETIPASTVIDGLQQMLAAKRAAAKG